MKYVLTSAETAKLLRKIQEERALCASQESNTSVFQDAVGEDVESVRPEYDYESTQAFLDSCDEKIRTIKHALNVFNASTLVGDTGMTIDEVLVYLPQLNEKKTKLNRFQMRLPKQRVNAYSRVNTLIDYTYTNYDIEQAKKDFLFVSDRIRKLQTALDLVNTTEVLEFELDD